MQNRFSDNFSGDISGSNSGISGFYNKTRTVGQGNQSWVLMGVLGLGLIGGIGSRLVYLQLNQGAKNRQVAENNRVRTVAKPPVRGNIYDRKGRLLAGNKLSHSIFIWPLATKRENWLKTRRRIAEILDLDEQMIQTKVAGVSINSTQRVRIVRDLSEAQITALREYGADKEGVDVDIESVRYYPGGQLAAHVLGYTGEMNDRELKKLRPQGYRLGDVTGKMGLESTLESRLRGEWGGTQVEVDGAGRLQQFLGQKVSKSGQDVTITIDLELQKVAEAALGTHKAAIVAMDPRNGEILAMASRPAFDPNSLSGRISPSVWKQLQGQDHPFVNRALSAFPPASTFKIVTTTAALESGKFKPDTILQTYASLRIGGFTFADWNHAGFGPLGFPGALKWSSDTFFYQVGQRVGGPTMIDWTRKYGYGKKTGIELPEEAKGLVADDTWKQLNYKTQWSIGDTINMSIGQGFLQATPLQVAGMFAVPANGGYHVQPHLVKDAEKREWRESMNLKPSTIATIRKGLREVVDGGTGAAMNTQTIPKAAGKSGTAEAPPGPSHVWFGSYAPLDKPEIVVVAFGEHTGGGGGKTAAPMVLKVMEAYFNGGKPLPITPEKDGKKSAAPKKRVDRR
ncbi:penicillin-binding protein 2 [Chamaesiphon sp. VAR_48_metabat_135_sub]|uniref:penicillin-binding protein 2 n=1 Tax=Chamaesiphon sp. VAR_48_metabat_135_sub TaxID=2964699 RepID=UPI00286B4F59|nr:penicillin-binding protein 2 [Chamaesiphon sp. VAR_48_metabat_135_sub]